MPPRPDEAVERGAVTEPAVRATLVMLFPERTLVAPAERVPPADATLPLVRAEGEATGEGLTEVPLATLPRGGWPLT